MKDAVPTAIAIGEAVLFQELDNEVVLLNMSDQQYYGLNEVGAEMWKCLLETGSVAAAGDKLSDTYDVGEEMLRADLERLVRSLLNAGLLRAG